MKTTQELFPELVAAATFMVTQMWDQNRTVLFVGGIMASGKSMAACRIAEEALRQGREVHYASPTEPRPSLDEQYAHIQHPQYHLHTGFSWYRSLRHDHSNRVRFLEVLATFEDVARHTPGAVFVLDHLVQHLAADPQRTLAFFSLLDRSSCSLVLPARSGHPGAETHRQFGMKLLLPVMQQRLAHTQLQGLPEDYVLHVISHQVESIFGLSSHLQVEPAPSTPQPFHHLTN